ncbi:hypothetical protein GJ744_011330 [Endocarpon pusillum]|uniref:Peptidase A1 domain-containing protein n=1 Tax=Endocarpon pusillum TaxID=364733 RepID=A0A8H7AT37_9EURO|nr:hypothetical protein GJ744_011330 [Endocarpon pusillum]
MLDCWGSTRKRSFKIPRVQQHNYVPDGTFALRKAYRKFGLGTLDTYPGVHFTPKVAAANGGNETENGEVSASPTQNDAEFLSPVSVGGQMLVLNFDSGSSDMWVFNTGLPARSQQGHTLYDPSKSYTSAPLQGSTFNISYGDGSFSRGPVVTDTVDVGGATVEKQAIGIPNTVSRSFTEDVNSNGLVGLGFSKINTIKPERQKTFFDNIQPKLSQPVWTASLRAGEAGAYEFGNIDRSLFQGELAMVPVDTTRGFWQFNSAQFAVGDSAPQTASTGSGTAIADTGTSLMLMDDEIVEAYYAAVDGARLRPEVGGFTFPCASPLPDLKVAVGDSYMATVSGKLMNFAQAGTDTESGETVCFGGVQSNRQAPLQIFGDVFFKSQFVVFNGAEPPSLGLAPHA